MSFVYYLQIIGVAHITYGKLHILIYKMAKKMSDILVKSTLMQV